MTPVPRRRTGPSPRKAWAQAMPTSSHIQVSIHADNASGAGPCCAPAAWTSVLSYVYRCTCAGVPCIFWEHFFDWGEDMRNTISTLIDVRKRNGIKSDSKLEILCAEGDMYVARINERCVALAVLSVRWLMQEFWDLHMNLGGRLMPCLCSLLMHAGCWSSWALATTWAASCPTRRKAGRRQLRARILPSGRRSKHPRLSTTLLFCMFKQLFSS